MTGNRAELITENLGLKPLEWCFYCIQEVKKMKTKSIISLLSLSIMGMSIYAGQANSSDYRALTPEEKSRLTAALLKQGCRNPKAMKFDVETNQFEAEDAVCEGGRKYDIYLDKNFRIVSMKPD